MTKNTKIVYVYLALFAFTLGFSFTLASQAQAEPICCTVPCPYPYESWPSVEGHIVYSSCIVDWRAPCNHAFICPEN